MRRREVVITVLVWYVLAPLLVTLYFTMSMHPPLPPATPPSVYVPPRDAWGYAVACRGAPNGTLLCSLAFYAPTEYIGEMANVTLTCGDKVYRLVDILTGVHPARTRVLLVFEARPGENCTLVARVGNITYADVVMFPR